MGELALVTGASSGIGKAYADRLGADGCDLIVVGRRAERLRQLAEALSVDVEVVVADLATDAGIDAVAALCAEKPLTLLVDNTGVPHDMPMADLSAQQTLGEVVCAPGVEDPQLLQSVLDADLAAFGGQSPALPTRYQEA